MNPKPLLGLWLLLAWTWSPAQENVRLTLPPEIYAVPGVEMNVYFSNTVLVEREKEGNLAFAVECAVGSADATRWTLNAAPAQAGAHPFKLTVKDAAGKILGSAKSSVVVSPTEAGNGQKVNLLIIGDSLTHASHYPNELARLLSQPGNPAWHMIGTHQPGNVHEGVRHEGYGGWTWKAFRTLYKPDAPTPSATVRRQTSPFVYANGMDFARYIQEAGAAPDFITIMLGINDCFRAKPEDPDPDIETMFGEAERVLAELRRAAPHAEIGVCLTTPGNARDAAFIANYPDRYLRWGWRRIQHRLVERQIAQFSRRQTERIFLIPTELNLDCMAGYPDNNAVHPNEAGYRQIGASIYSWMKNRLQHPHVAITPEVREQALAVLREGLSGSDFWPAMHAAEALTLAGYGPEVRVALAAKLPTETDDQKRCGLAREMARTGDRDQGQAILGILSGENPHGHVHAAESLFKVRVFGDGTALRKAFASEDVRLKLMSGAALTRMGDASALAFIRETLDKHENPEIYRIAGWILGQIGDESDIAPIRQRLTAGGDQLDASTRAFLEHALALLGEAEGRAALERNLVSPDAGVRAYAATFAGDLEEMALIPKLQAMLADATPDVRYRAAQSLLVLAK